MKLEWDSYKIWLIFVILTVIILLSYLISIIISVFRDNDADSLSKPLVLDMTGSPLDVAKRYFKTNPYVTITRGGKKILCRDGGRTENICENIRYINQKVSEILKQLNQERNDCKQIKIETENEFIHHVLIEVLLVLLQLMDLGLDSGTNFCQKKSIGVGYISICPITSADSTKED